MTISEGPSETDTPVDVARPGVFSGPLHTPVPPPSARTLTEAHQTAAWRAPERKTPRNCSRKVLAIPLLQRRR